MENGIFSLIPRAGMTDVLDNLQKFTGLAIQLVDSNGAQLMTFGDIAGYCRALKGHLFQGGECLERYRKAGQLAHSFGEAYIFSCHANLTNIAFPLTHHGELLGSVIVGPFLMDSPDSTLVSDLSEKYHLNPSVFLELYDELCRLPVLVPQKVNQLKKLLEQLVSSLIPSARSLLLENRQKAAQQAMIGETIKMYKDTRPEQSLLFFYEKEKELLKKLRTGSNQEVKRLLNDLIGFVLFSEGARLDVIRIRVIELTTLLSRVAIDGGAKPDCIFRLNSDFVSRLYREQTFEDLCLLMQEVLDGFMNAMYSGVDKGNPYIRKALRYIAENYHQHIELSGVAEHVGLSACYFSSLFSRVVGISFREYLCRFRVEESKNLLLSNSFSLADIAVSMGFPDQSYYCKVFKRIVGITPGKYRE